MNTHTTPKPIKLAIEGLDSSSHSSLANGYNNLAMIQLKQGRFEEALANFERTLQIELAIGNMLDIAVTYNNIGGVYHEKNNFIKAKYFYKKASRKALTVLSRHHPSVVLYKNNMVKARKNIRNDKFRKSVDNGENITGQWYNWRTAYKRQNNQTEWRANLLNAAPKSYLGVIVYFATLGDLKSLQTSLTQLSRTLSNNPRPVVIFHEDNLSNNDIQQSLAQILGNSTPLTFEHIKFSNSSIQPERLHRRCQGTLFETFKKFP
ncbi:unnamed protein product [Rotaria magnacalcarata]|uniref:Tetratricopeptide repeat protein n=2 Tax=Rotaria magnacalcarata TaxID=392030 RepID=A0A817ASY7_9BILA|nr:unnamed protein product [Rotaria magnacalcarata]